MTSLRQLQSDLVPWQKHNFPGREKWEPLAGLTEELGELSHAFLKKHQGIRMNEPHDINIQDAVGDILIFLADFCNELEIDMQDCLNEVWSAVKLRDHRPGEEPPHPFPA